MVKISKYQDFKVTIERMWEKKAMVMPVVIEALGAVYRDLLKHPKTMGLDKISPSKLQKQHYWEQLTSCENTSEIPRSSERTRTTGDRNNTGSKLSLDPIIKRNNNNNSNSNIGNGNRNNNNKNNSKNNSNNSKNSNENNKNNDKTVLIIIIIIIIMIIMIIMMIIIIIIIILILIILIIIIIQ